VSESRLLLEGELRVEGRLVTASNATFFGRLHLGDDTVACVYKPVAGERPLWDFPDGTLAAREVATYAVSEATGWAVVPSTVLREGPYGPGMCQVWVDSVDGEDLVDIVPVGETAPGWIPVLEAVDGDDRPVLLVHADDPRLRRMSLLDVVCNNADRKGGHILLTEDGRVHGVDHGLCFNVEDKLRTVLWGWAGSRLDREERRGLESLGGQLDADLGTRLRTLLTDAEVAALRRRLDRLLSTGRFPRPGARWPVIPWPAF